MRSIFLKLAPVLLAVGLVTTACSNGSPGPDETHVVQESYKSLGASATQSYNAGTGVLLIMVTPGKSLKPGWCLDAIFDWGFDSPNHPHHDPRMLRVCQTGAVVRHQFTDSPNGLRGLNKAALCYDPATAKKPVAADCRFPVQYDGGGITLVNIGPLPNSCMAYYEVAADGRVSQDDGGSATSC